MGMLGLRELLERDVPTTATGRDGFFDVEDSFCTPGFWSAYAARARQRGVHTGDALLNIHPHRGWTYETISIEWQGVAAACRFHSSQVRLAVQAETETEFQRIFTNLVREAE